MKILVTYTRDTFNYGTAMMAINLLSYLNKALGGNVEFFTDARGKENLSRLISSTGLDNIYINEILPKRNKAYRYKVFTFLNDVNCNPSWIKKYARGVMQHYDAIVVLGGDVISEYYNKMAAILSTYKLNIISKKIPVFLASQTIGPFTSWREKVAKRFLNGSFIYVRDLWTAKYLRETLRLNKVYESADLAFLDLPRQSIEGEIKKTLGSHFLEREKYVTLVPSGLVNSYTKNKTDYVLSWRDIVLNLLNEEHLKDLKIVLLPHVVRPFKVDDRVIINQILTQLPIYYQGRVIPIYDILLPHQARIILGNGVITITGRMHAAISTFQMGKPAICLSYGVKYKGVIEDTLGIKNLIVDATQDEHWKLGVISDEVKLKVDYVLKNYAWIQSEVNKAVTECKEKAQLQIDHIAQILRSSGK